MKIQATNKELVYLLGVYVPFLIIGMVYSLFVIQETLHHTVLSFYHVGVSWVISGLFSVASHIMLYFSTKERDWYIVGLTVVLMAVVILCDVYGVRTISNNQENRETKITLTDYDKQIAQKRAELLTILPDMVDKWGNKYHSDANLNLKKGINEDIERLKTSRDEDIKKVQEKATTTEHSMYWVSAFLIFFNVIGTFIKREMKEQRANVETIPYNENQRFHNVQQQFTTHIPQRAQVVQSVSDSDDNEVLYMLKGYAESIVQNVSNASFEDKAKVLQSLDEYYKQENGKRLPQNFASKILKVNFGDVKGLREFYQNDYQKQEPTQIVGFQIKK